MRVKYYITARILVSSVEKRDLSQVNVGKEPFCYSIEGLLRVMGYKGTCRFYLWDFVVVYFILGVLLYLAFSANLGLLCMPHPDMGPLV